MKGKDINGKARQIITMDEHGNVTVPNGEIWMGEYEIADLFGVFGHTIRTQVKEIYNTLTEVYRGLSPSTQGDKPFSFWVVEGQG